MEQIILWLMTFLSNQFKIEPVNTHSNNFIFSDDLDIGHKYNLNKSNTNNEKELVVTPINHKQMYNFPYILDSFIIREQLAIQVISENYNSYGLNNISLYVNHKNKIV